ncbi:MAG: phosphomethylpyrimidine kinase [Herbinix sp.]|jgi:hydroxymethylpyrimidine/phosphomethylpyrimidine kinase|nr:phosphomethylpyrimidine kinase [Herbinix sp.]
MKKILSIAGSDCSGGAGIQADIKTITAHKMYGMTVITALTAQNTTGVTGVLPVSKDFVGMQLDSVFTDIVPDVVKIGMVSQKEIIDMIADKLIQYQVKKIVLDPVMISTSGSRLLQEDAMDALINKLMPLATIITPNIPEAECLCGYTVKTKEQMQQAAKDIGKRYHGSILIKGGHLEECSDDLLYSEGTFHWYEQETIKNPNTHGTGCTLSSAIACNMAEGIAIKNCIRNAKNYITGALMANLDLGAGRGPLNHSWNF